MKPFWSDGSVIQTSLSLLQVSSPRTRSCKTGLLVRLLSISWFSSLRAHGTDSQTDRRTNGRRNKAAAQLS